MKNINKFNAIFWPIIASLWTLTFIGRVITYNGEDNVLFILNCITAVVSWVAAVLNIYRYKKNK